jgi:hypothetical protein
MVLVVYSNKTEGIEGVEGVNFIIPLNTIMSFFLLFVITYYHFMVLVVYSNKTEGIEGVEGIFCTLRGVGRGYRSLTDCLLPHSLTPSLNPVTECVANISFDTPTSSPRLPIN